MRLEKSVGEASYFQLHNVHRDKQELFRVLIESKVSNPLQSSKVLRTPELVKSIYTLPEA